MNFIYRAWNFYLDFLNDAPGPCLFVTGAAILILVVGIDGAIFEPRRNAKEEA